MSRPNEVRAGETLYAVIAGFVGVAVLALVLLMVRLVPGLAQVGPALPVAAAVALAGVIVAILRPTYVYYGFLFSCMIIPLVLDEVSIPLGFMRVYVQDIVFGFNFGLILARTTVGKTVFHRIPFNRYVLLHLALGVWGTVNGFLQGNAFDYTLGDFRRAFFYFVNYFVALYLTANYGDVRKLLRVLWLGGIAIIGKGALQVLFGQFYYRRIGDAAHILSHFELTFLSFTVLYALNRLLFSGMKHRVFWTMVLVAGLVTTLVGNYRAAWLSIIGSVLFVFLYLPGKRKLLVSAMAAMGIVFTSLAISVMWEVQIEGHTTIGQEIKAKADVSKTGEDPNVIWRFQSYQNAFSLWRERPLLGMGLGEELEFSASTSTGGAMMAMGHRVHNSFLWMLMSLGVLGFVAFLFVQYKYFTSLLSYIKNSRWEEGRTIVLTCAAFYVSFMISTSFEIFLESAMPVTVLTATMALSQLVILYTPKMELSA